MKDFKKVLGVIILISILGGALVYFRNSTALPKENGADTFVLENSAKSFFEKKAKSMGYTELSVYPSTKLSGENFPISGLIVQEEYPISLEISLKSPFNTIDYVKSVTIPPLNTEDVQPFLLSIDTTKLKNGPYSVILRKIVSKKETSKLEIPIVILNPNNL